MHRSFGSAILAVLLVTSVSQADDLAFERLKLDAAFRSEGVAAADVNHDGKLDVLAGEVWYEAPDWKMHEIRKTGKYDGATGYSNSFNNWAYDVNGDGWDDLVCICFPGAPCCWFENPQNKEGHWPRHDIWRSACNESPQFGDLTGDGKPELILSSQPEGQMGYLEIPAADKVNDMWKFVAVSTEKAPGTERFSHGLGIGDVNRDGRNDVITPQGWWEQPAKLTGEAWSYHPLSLTAPGEPGAPSAADIYAYDLDLDGDNDLIMSAAHRRGVWWFENTGSNAEPKYKTHLIEDRYTQTHALQLVDMNGDGTKDLVTGKRFYAHGPKGDIDPQGDVVMYWYEIQRKNGTPPKITPHKIDAGNDTGVGTQFQVIDINGDKRPDIVLSNKKGTNVLLQRAPASK